MQVSYKKLWILCAQREIGKGELRKQSGLSPATFTKLRRNQEVSLTALMKIAQVLKCNFGDMADFIPDSTENDTAKD